MSKDMLGVSEREAWEVVADLIEKLGGCDGDEWLSATQRFLRKEDPWLLKKCTIIPASIYWADVHEYIGG